jgi:hypothetical protein
MTVIRPIITAAQVEDAVKLTLQTWFNTYLREIEIQGGLTALELPLPRSYTVVNELDDFPELQLPRVLIISPGTVGDPRAEGDGTMTFFWRVGIGIVAQGNTRETTNRNTKLYAAAARAILLQKQGLGGLATNIDLESEEYDEYSPDQSRTLGVASLVTIVTIPGAVNRRGGPAVAVPPDPDTIPGSNWPIATTADIEITRE